MTERAMTEGELRVSLADVALRVGKVAVMLDWATVAGLAMSREPGYGNALLREAAKEAIANADAVLRPHLGPGDAVWSVNHVHTPWVSHGREVVALLTDKAAAEAYADLCRERHAELEAKNRELLAERGFDVTKMQDDETTYDVNEWAVDDPVVLRAIVGRGEVERQ